MPDIAAEPAPDATILEAASVTTAGALEETVGGAVLAASPDQDAFLADIAWLADITHRPEPIWGVEAPSLSPAGSSLEKDAHKDAHKDRKRTLAA